MSEINEEKIYLDFFNSLIDDKTDRKIIELVNEDLEEEKIIEKLLKIKEQ